MILPPDFTNSQWASLFHRRQKFWMWSERLDSTCWRKSSSGTRVSSPGGSPGAWAGSYHMHQLSFSPAWVPGTSAVTHTSRCKSAERHSGCRFSYMWWRVLCFLHCQNAGVFPPLWQNDRKTTGSCNEGLHWAFPVTIRWLFSNL